MKISFRLRTTHIDTGPSLGTVETRSLEESRYKDHKGKKPHQPRAIRGVTIVNRSVSPPFVGL